MNTRICKGKRNMFSVMNHAGVGKTRVIFNGVSYELPKKAIFKNGNIKKSYIRIIMSTYDNMTRENAEKLLKHDIVCNCEVA